MDKASLPLGINPVGKVSALSAVANIGSPIQSLESRATYLAQQQANLASQLATSAGLQKLMSTAEVSTTAKLINSALLQVKAAGLSEQYIAQSILTQTPKNAAVVAQQLQAAISQSGLFYESHLKALADGQHNLAELKQEPQIKSPHLIQSLLPQQLHILEHQRISWHGEVWPNQLMDWDVYKQENQQEKSQSKEVGNASTFIASELSLDLPRLGKVTAKISLRDGRVRIGFDAEQEATLHRLKAKSPALVSAIESNGQQLESLTVSETKVGAKHKDVHDA